MSSPHRILCIVGARPNFMKIAPIMAAFSQLGERVGGLQLPCEDIGACEEMNRDRG